VILAGPARRPNNGPLSEPAEVCQVSRCLNKNCASELV
jgi:hypothetical protein